jgi:hypothetical protein
MRNLVLSNTILLSLSVAVVVLAALGFILWIRRRPSDPSEIEQQRRAYLNRVGRIIEGNITEIVEQRAPVSEARSSRFPRRQSASVPANTERQQTVVFYSYSISGVSYESAQDVTGLEERACVQQLTQGQQASVKYDPSNPGNSILVADHWSGLR